MRRCTRDGCRWQAIAASRDAAAEQYARHLVEAHTTERAADVPEGMVQVRFGEDDEWRTVTPDEVRSGWHTV